MTEPMTDAELAALRHIHEREGLSTYPPGNTAFDRLFARLDAERTRADAAEAERDAAVARAMPEPRLLRTVEEVEALPEGYYLGRDRRALRLLRRRPSGLHGWPDGTLIPLEPNRCVGAWISGPIHDLPLPAST